MAENLSDLELYREYRRRQFKYTLIFLLIAAIVLIPSLGISYLYCEHLTEQYAQDIRADILSEVLSSEEKLIEFKVLKYKDKLIPEASVYIVADRKEMVYKLYHRYGQWNIEEYTGSFAWPYSLIPDFSVSIGS